MEIKLASYSFKCDANRKYDQTVRRLNKLSESPIHFAFTTAFGIKYDAVDQSFAPPYFMKVNGMPYWRMLFANNAS